MPRKKKRQPRSEVISQRLTPREKLALHEKAMKSGLPLHEFCRRALLRAAGRRACARRTGPAAPPERLLDAPTWHQLRGIAVNMNQIARHWNTFPEHPPPSDFNVLLESLRALINATAVTYGP